MRGRCLYLELPKEGGAGPGVCGKLILGCVGSVRQLLCGKVYTRVILSRLDLSEERLVVWFSIMKSGVFCWLCMGMISRLAG